jgi:hypothetical protein
MGDPTSSYATGGIALRVSGALKPYHHDKVRTSSVEILNNKTPGSIRGEEFIDQLRDYRFLNKNILWVVIILGY